MNVFINSGEMLRYLGKIDSDKHDEKNSIFILKVALRIIALFEMYKFWGLL